jgi:hypothetical protein
MEQSKRGGNFELSVTPYSLITYDKSISCYPSLENASSTFWIFLSPYDIRAYGDKFLKISEIRPSSAIISG